MKKFLRTAAFAGVMAAAFAQTASASPTTYDVFLSGPNEFPPNASPGTGFAVVILDPFANTMEVDLSFHGLLGTTTASHIHCCTAVPDAGTAGVATTTPTFSGFPLGVTSGTYDQILDMTSVTSYNPAYITANGGTALSAEAALFAGIAAGDAYLNIHSSVVPGGEIRGFLVLAPVPEPATVALFGAGIAGFGAIRRRRIAKGS